MSAVLDGIRSKAGAENCADSCSRHGCRVDLTDAPSSRVIVDVDKAFQAHKREGERCDFVLFLDRDKGSVLVVPIELKSGQTRASEAVGQLQGGADFAACFAPASGADCLPVLIHGKGIHPKQRNALNRAKIAFRGRKMTVKMARCDRPRNLARVLAG